MLPVDGHSMSAPPTDSGRARSWVALIAWLLGATVLVIHARSYPPLTYDDAFISLRYSQRLLEGQGLTWTDGLPVEGYSNLLWVLGCAFLAVLGVDLLDTPVVLGIASAIAAIGGVVYAFAPRSWSDSLPAFAAALFLAVAGPIGLWAVTGLEGCLVAALLAWAVAFLRPLADATVVDTKRALTAGVPLALLCVTRPDGPLFTVAACAFIVLWGRSRGALRQAFWIGVLPGIATLGQLGFRWMYYGDWVPNTARAKVALSATRFEIGTQCIASAGSSSYALWAPAMLVLFVALRDPRRRPRIGLVLTLFLAWTAYASSTGCDMYGYRMLIPSLVLLTFLTAEVLDWAQAQGGPLRVVAWLGALALLLAFAMAQRADPSIEYAREHWPPATESAATIGRTLRSAFEASDPLLAVDAAGVIPYYSGFRALDMLGLNDAHIGRQRHESFGEGVQGHELGDGTYVLSREPDLIVSGTLGSGGLRYRGGREMRDLPRFVEEYSRIRVGGAEPVSHRFYAFVRVGGTIGIQHTDDTVTIPGFLFANKKGTIAELNDANELETRFEGLAAPTVKGVRFAAGTWQLRTTGNGDFVLSILSGGRTITEDDDVVEFTLAHSARLDIMVVASEPATLFAVMARRLGH
jgi:arabinofuranosyltransferase